MVRANGVTISLDGFMAGPDQSPENPLGIGGQHLHEWAWATKTMRGIHGLDGGEEGVEDALLTQLETKLGATIMGRNMFGPVRGPWTDLEWKGWWGDDPPFHHPVFVLTEHRRPSIPMEGGTKFHFVTEGIHAALDMALEAAQGRDVKIGGGASTLRQFLAAGLIEDFHLAVAPVLLGSGERLFDGLTQIPSGYRVAETVKGEIATHYRLRRL